MIEFHACFTCTGEKPLKCPFPECPKWFASNANMYKHMKIHDKTRFEGKFSFMKDYNYFTIFGKKYPYIILIRYSISPHPAGPPSHVCDHCGKGFYILGTLYHHRRRVHLGLEKAYIKRRQEKYLKPSECDVSCWVT